MRVPTYQRQTATTNKTGAINFSVRANPGALSAGLSAAGNAARALEGAAIDYIKKENKERRLNQLTKAENNYKVEMQNLKFSSLSEDPNTVINGNAAQGKKSWEDNARASMNKIADALSDKKVRKAFLGSAEQIMIGERSSVFQNARNRQIDISVADELQQAEILVQDAVQGNKHQRDVALLQLFGGQIENGVVVDGLYDQMAKRGLIDYKEAFRRNTSTRQRISKSDFRSRLAAADRSADPAQAATLVADVMDPQKFAFMKPEDRDTGLKQAVDLEQTLRKRQIADAEKQEKTDKRQQIKRHKDSARALLAKIQKFKADPDNQTFKDQLPRPLEIAEALATDRINETTAKLLTDLLNDEDAEQRDPAFILDVFNKIGDAETPDEIDDQLDRLEGKIGAGGTVPLNDAINIQKYGDSKKANTRESGDIKFYQNQLNDLTGQTAFRLSGIGVGQDEIQRQLDAEDTYRRLVLDPDAPLKPRDAYLQVAEQFVRARKAQINFLAPASFLQRHFNGETPQTWTRESVAAARQSIQNAPDMSQLEKSLEFETLDLIIAEIEKIQEAAVVGEPQDGDTSRSSWFSGLSIFNPNSLRDQQNDLRNPE
tara:strand:+ start:6284 stop:8086 length:1803 start_codon:yes stop_codon:yes gene_type:complete